MKRFIPIIILVLFGIFLTIAKKIGLGLTLNQRFKHNKSSQKEKKTAA